MSLHNYNWPIFSIASIFLSLLCLIIILKINHDLSLRYLSSDGKTQALFGLVEILDYSYKYWFVGLSFGGVIASILGKREMKVFQSFGFH
jgi:hypothetical protein